MFCSMQRKEKIVFMQINIFSSMEQNYIIKKVTGSIKNYPEWFKKSKTH